MNQIADAANLLGAIVVLLGLAAFVSVWTHRAPGNRALTMGLYLVFGGFGFFLFMFGLGSSYRDWREGTTPGVQSLLALSVGVIAALTLTPPLRKQLARIIPFDPARWTDTTGLFLLGSLGALSIFSLSQNEATTEAVSYVELAVSALAYTALAFIFVGYNFHRTFRQALTRLGLEIPTLKQVGIAIGFVFLAFAIAIASNVLLQLLQPDLADDISENLRTMTSNVDTLWGALILGLCAGVGEEILFRGAIQPRFGIIFTALIFAVLHQQYGASMVTVGVFGVGIMFGVLRNRTNTTCCIITHMLYNTAAVALGQIDTDDAETARHALHLLLTTVGLG